MYLVRTKTEDSIVNTVNEVKEFDKKEISKIYSLTEVDYNELVSTSDIRDCVYDYLKGDQKPKEDILEYVSEKLSVKKNEVSKIITAMKKEKIIYVVSDFGWLGIN